MTTPDDPERPGFRIHRDPPQRPSTSRRDKPTRNTSPLAKTRRPAAPQPEWSWPRVAYFGIACATLISLLVIVVWIFKG